MKFLFLCPRIHFLVLSATSQFYFRKSFQKIWFTFLCTSLTLMFLSTFRVYEIVFMEGKLGHLQFPLLVIAYLVFQLRASDAVSKLDVVWISFSCFTIYWNLSLDFRSCVSHGGHLSLGRKVRLTLDCFLF